MASNKTRTITTGTEPTPKTNERPGEASRLRADALKGLGAATARSTDAPTNRDVRTNQPITSEKTSNAESSSSSNVIPAAWMPRTSAPGWSVLLPCPTYTLPATCAPSSRLRSPNPASTSPPTGALIRTFPNPASTSPPTGPSTSTSPNPEWTSPSTSPLTRTSPQAVEKTARVSSVEPTIRPQHALNMLIARITGSLPWSSSETSAATRRAPASRPQRTRACRERVGNAIATLWHTDLLRILEKSREPRQALRSRSRSYSPQHPGQEARCSRTSRS